MDSIEIMHQRGKERREIQRSSRENLGKFFYDLAKITFTALVVGSVVSLSSTSNVTVNVWLIILGVFSTFILSYVGFKTIK